MQLQHGTHADIANATRHIVYRVITSSAKPEVRIILHTRLFHNDHKFLFLRDGRNIKEIEDGKFRLVT